MTDELFDFDTSNNHRRFRSRGAKSAKRADSQRRNARRRRSDATNQAEGAESAMDDTKLFNENNLPSEGVIFGVYGADEWATSSHLRESIEGKKNTLAMEGTWITPAGWNFGDWVSGRSTRYNFTSMNRALMFMDFGIIEASVSRGKLELELNGEPAAVKAFIASLDTELKRAENLIEWVYSARGDSISVPLNYRPAIAGAYPWLPKDINSYIDDYLNSQASVLILIGKPGTGKTTFIKNLIHRSGGDAKVTYDETVMAGDSLFANFIESETKFMIMEDADAFLKKREDGNTMMHRFLNVSDGLISAQDKKLVFSTNLPSVRDIDAALMRPGRCFDVVEFRALTRAEAQVIADELSLTLPAGDEITLAEMFNVQPSESSTVPRKVNRSIGFS